MNIEYLYERAKNGPVAENSDDHMSKSKLNEIKNIILAKSSSSCHGFHRTFVKSETPLSNNQPTKTHVDKHVINEIVKQLENQ